MSPRWPICVAFALPLVGCASTPVGGVTALVPAPREVHALDDVPDSRTHRAATALLLAGEREVGVDWRSAAGEGTARSSFRVDQIDGRSIAPGIYLLPAGRHALRVREDRSGAVMHYLLEVDLQPGRVYGLDLPGWWDRHERGNRTASGELRAWPPWVIPRAECADVTDDLDPSTLRRIRTAKIRPFEPDGEA